MDFGEKGLNQGLQGCVSNEELEKREDLSISRFCGKCGVGEIKLGSTWKHLTGDGKCIPPKLQFTPHVETTLRDRFAMAALTGLLASCDGVAWGVNQFPLGDQCYAYADQLLEARKK